MKKIVFLGSKSIGCACLQYLVDQQGELNIKIIAIATNTHSKSKHDIATIAQQNAIPIIQRLEELPECDLILSVQYHEILKKAHIAKAKLHALNLHLAPLPEYRGCNQFSFAIMNEATEFGVSIHEIDTKIDHGTLYFEKRFPISKEIWVEDLLKKSYEEGVALFKKSISDIVNLRLSPIAPRKNIISRLYLREDIQQLKVVDLNESESEINKKIRATSMPGFEPPYTIINKKKVYFTKAYK